MSLEIKLKGKAVRISYSEALKDGKLGKILKTFSNAKAPQGFAQALELMKEGIVIAVEPRANAEIKIMRKGAEKKPFGAFLVFGENSRAEVFYKTSISSDSLEARGIFLGAGADVQCCLVQANGMKSASMAFTVANLGERSSLKLMNSNLGSKSREDRLLILQQGRASRCEHFEVSLADGNQAYKKDSDHFHLAPDTYSRSIFKYATAGNSRVNVEGKVTIEKTAPGSDTHLLAKSLLLSEKSMSKVVPMLFVRNSEVAAGHGSALTPMQEEELFYLRSRGVGENESRLLVLQGFLNDLLIKSEIGEQLLSHVREELYGFAQAVFPRD